MTDIEISQALRIIDQTLEPERLNGVQELVLRECWRGKTYQEIASISGYDSDYIRVVGSKLWQNLSQAFEEKVSKHNFKSVLRQRIKQSQFSLSNLEFPDGQVPLNSRFYIERPPCEERGYEEVLKPGGFIVIKSPMNMGKTSLMIRILAQARSQNYQTVTLNFQLAEASVLSDLAKLLRWIMANMTLQLGIKSEIARFWDEDLGTKISCTNYLQNYILAQLTEPLVLAFDKINHLFEYPQIAQEFLPLIRFWHEESNNIEAWQSLRIVVVHSTDSYIPLDTNQSPFNLGLPIVLTEFSFDQVRELANRYKFKQEVDNLDCSLASLMEMVGGYPYLIRLAFYALSSQNLTFEQLLTEAPTPTGIYRSYLQKYFVTLQKHPELIGTFNQIVSSESPIQISSIAAYKLESMGLIKLFENRAVPSCLLYRLFFRDYI